MIITADMLRECRAKIDGVIVVDAADQPVVRSAIHYDGRDPIYDGSGDQVVVLEADDLTSVDPDATDEEIAEDLSRRWADLATEARDYAGYSR